MQHKLTVLIYTKRTHTHTHIMTDDLFLVYVLSFINYKLSSVLAKLRVNMQLFFAHKMSCQNIDTERHQYHFTSQTFWQRTKCLANGEKNKEKCAMEMKMRIRQRGGEEQSEREWQQ